jgi:hypothetical protein
MSVAAPTIEPNSVKDAFIREHTREADAANAHERAAKQYSDAPARAAISFQNGFLRQMVSKRVFGPRPSSPKCSDGVLAHSFRSHLPAGIARLKFDGFCQDWGARFIRQEGELFTYHIDLPVSFFKRFLGQEPVLVVQFRLLRPKSPAEPLTTVDVKISASGCSPRQAARYLRAVGDEILKSILLHFQMHPDRRLQARMPLERGLKFYPALPAFKPRDIVDGQGMDISTGGMRFWSPNTLSSSHVGIDMPVSVTSGSVSVLGRVLRVLPGKEGGYEVAVAFPEEE